MNDTEMNDLLKKEMEAIGPDPWMETYTGIRFFLFDEEDTDQINDVDIAHALSLNCRYNGHCRSFYSVAEHSVLMSYLSPNPLEGLLHDATEAYLSDIVRPFKRVMPTYMDLEKMLYERIAKKYGLPTTMDHQTKQMDLAICKLEAEQLMSSRGRGWGLDTAALSFLDLKKASGYDRLPCWTPEEAEKAFLDRLKELYPVQG